MDSLTPLAQGISGMLNRFFMVLAVVIAIEILNAASLRAESSIAILPFKDRSKFQGKWKLEEEFPMFLGKVLAENPFYRVLPHDSVMAAVHSVKKFHPENTKQLSEIGRQLGADVVITAEINDFNLARFTVGDPALGGYKSYSGIIDLRAIRLIRVLDSSEVGVVDRVEEKISDRDLGLDLFGRPRQRDTEFFNLDKVVFGSEAFLQTIIGQTTLKAMQEVRARIEEMLKPPPSIGYQTDGKPPIILSVSGDEAYINIGIEDSISIGNKFAVSSSPQEASPIGQIQVITLLGPHLSKVKILHADKAITPNCVIRSEKGREKQQPAAEETPQK
ncbi:MAG: hypothetical protein HY709_10625 [Candidatus Latescibacteria bacterium]|nr:hypothetical protein [Candidatus Latescibacterota bacterium]